MSEEHDTRSTDTHTPHDEKKTLLGTLLDIGAGWTSHGLNASKFTLENSARMLDKTAKAVEGFARDFEKSRKISR